MIKSESIQMVEAFWISPKGEIIEVPDTHILRVLDDPQKFGTSLEEIENEYKTEKEELGSEGNARINIIKRLVKSGWIRLRYYSRSAMWSVNVPCINEVVKNHLYKWANYLLKVSPSKYTPYDVVNIDAPDQKLSMSIKDIANDYLLTNDDVLIKL